MSLRTLIDDWRNISHAMTPAERGHTIATSTPTPRDPAWLGELTAPADVASIGEWGPMGIDHDNQSEAA